MVLRPYTKSNGLTNKNVFLVEKKLDNGFELYVYASKKRESPMVEGKLIFFISLLVLAGILGKSACEAITGPQNKEQAEAEAKKFADQFFPGHGPVNCMPQDSNEDGYVSCSVLSGDGKVIAIECAKYLSMNSGCKMPQKLFPQQQQIQ